MVSGFWFFKSGTKKDRDPDPKRMTTEEWVQQWVNMYFPPMPAITTESSSSATLEETLKNQDEIKPGERNRQTNSPAKITSNSDTDFDAGNHPDESLIREPEGCFPKSPLRRTDHKKPSYNFGKSVRVMEKLQNNLVIVGEHLPFESEINSPLQLQETKRLQEEVAKKNSDLVKLKKQQDWLLKENKKLTKMQNSMAKEVDSLRQQIEKQAAKCYHDVANFMEFSFEELKDATNNFHNKFKIGEGGYGGVYKGVLYSTTVAIKIHRGGNQGEREFYQEVEILRKVRHPNIVTLIGGCLQNWALVYEFIPNGSLDNYLGTFGDRKSLSWRTRIQIATNICSALIFLHSIKPHGIAHGDLKPANILLDTHYQAKLGDFGISCQLMKSQDTITPLHLTEHPKGTLAYIDPEYMRTGEMNPQCDVYSFGIILLQLVTGKSAAGISKAVDEALQSHRLNKEMDVSAKWPPDKAIKLAKLGLRCCNLTRKNRPNLATEVWSEIESLKPDAST